MAFKIKIDLDDITYGPNEEDVDELHAFIVAGELTNMGYRKVSNAYCRVARVDRDDWLLVLANQLNCCVADFYNVDGSGISQRWVDHYIRTHSEDILTVHPQIMRLMKGAY